MDRIAQPSAAVIVQQPIQVRQIIGDLRLDRRGDGRLPRDRFGSSGLNLPSSVEDLLREEAPQVLGALTRRYGDFDAAEDATQEALIAAADHWPRDGVPDNPHGWLLRTASRRLTRPTAERSRSRTQPGSSAASSRAGPGGTPGGAPSGCPRPGAGSNIDDQVFAHPRASGPIVSTRPSSSRTAAVTERGPCGDAAARPRE